MSYCNIDIFIFDAGRFDEVLKLKLGDVHFRQPDLDGPLWLSVTVPFRNSNPIDRALGKETTTGAKE